MSRNLNDLDSKFRRLVFEFLARCTEHKAFVVIVDTWRTPEEQAEYLKKGVSWTKYSKHLTGEAIDICPLTSYLGLGTTKIDWDGTNPAWGLVGEIGEKLGLKWGVWLKPNEQIVVPSWRQRGEFINMDLGHFECIEKNKIII